MALEVLISEHGGINMVSLSNPVDRLLLEKSPLRGGSVAQVIQKLPLS